MSEQAEGLRGDARARLSAIAQMAQADPRQLDRDDLAALVDCLGSPQKAVQRPAAEACATLHAGGAPLRPLLVAALAAKEARLRWGAAYALSLADDDPREALPVALEELGSADGDVRWAAADIVQRLARRHPDAMRQLVLALDAEPPERRKMALYCLRDLAITSDEVRAAAVRALRDPNEGVALAALAALSRLAPQNDDAVAGTLALLAAPNPHLRRAAASALGHFGAGRPEIDASLRRAAASEDESLRRAAEGALRRRL